MDTNKVLWTCNSHSNAHKQSTLDLYQSQLTQQCTKTKVNWTCTSLSSHSNATKLLWTCTSLSSQSNEHKQKYSGTVPALAHTATQQNYSGPVPVSAHKAMNTNKSTLELYQFQLTQQCTKSKLLWTCTSLSSHSNGHKQSTLDL
jgi:hypothetical protein